MGLGDLGDKAKNLANDNRDKIEEQSDKVIDNKLDGDKSDKARDARDAQARVIDLVNELVRQDVIRLPSDDDEML